MYSEMLGEVRAEAFRREFYRNCCDEAGWPEAPRPEFGRFSLNLVWNALALFGEVLILAGTRMKKLARPVAA